MNGSITEDRFKKMTWIQWVFHYKMIMKNKGKELEADFNYKKSLFDTIKHAATFSHPNIDISKVLSKLSNFDPAEEAKKAYEFVEQNEDLFPKDLTVLFEQKEDAKVKKGKFDRKLGIVIPEN